jgi:TetR/AcrR family transcriptional repressor of nem operon
MIAKTSQITYRRAPQEKRELLLNAARELFSANGFDQTSTQQIARHAGVSEGILFHHFGSKRALFETVAELFMRAGAQAAMPVDRGEVTEEQVVRGAFDFADANPAMYKVLAEAGSSAGESASMSRSDVIVEAIELQLEHGIKEGKVRPGDARIMAELQLAVVDGAYRAWLKTNDGSLREAYITEAIRCMKAMLRTDDGGT